MAAGTVLAIRGNQVLGDPASPAARKEGALTWGRVGIGLVVAGALVGGAGGWLLWRQVDDSPPFP